MIVETVDSKPRVLDILGHVILLMVALSILFPCRTMQLFVQAQENHTLEVTEGQTVYDIKVLFLFVFTC